MDAAKEKNFARLMKGFRMSEQFIVPTSVIF